MIYLHEEILPSGLIRRWANEITDTTAPEYETPTYQIRKIGTMEYYAEAIDLTNANRIARGLQPYYYEVTDMPIEDETDDEQ